MNILNFADKRYTKLDDLLPAMDLMIKHIRGWNEKRRAENKALAKRVEALERAWRALNDTVADRGLTGFDVSTPQRFSTQPQALTPKQMERLKELVGRASYAAGTFGSGALSGSAAADIRAQLREIRRILGIGEEG